MAVRFTTIEKAASAEQIIERSRFIAHVKRTDSREEAESFIAAVRAEYRDATHNVPAFVIGEKQGIQWASDDGEPQGTSGAPVVQMLVKEGLTNLTVVVTRYFGGIKLGTGGLVRAYTSSARLVLELAGRHDVKDICHAELVLPYNLLGKAQNLAVELPFAITGINYTDKVQMGLDFEPEDEGRVLAAFSEMTSGSLTVLSKENFVR